MLNWENLKPLRLVLFGIIITLLTYLYFPSLFASVIANKIAIALLLIGEVTISFGNNHKAAGFIWLVLLIVFAAAVILGYTITLPTITQ